MCHSCVSCVSYLVLLSASEHGAVDFRFLTNTRYVFQKQVHGGTVDQNTAVVCGETHAFCLFSKIVLMIKTKYLYKNTKNIYISTKILFNSDDCNSCYLIFFQFLRRTSSILLFIILIHNTFVYTQKTFVYMYTRKENCTKIDIMMYPTMFCTIYFTMFYYLLLYYYYAF